MRITKISVEHLFGMPSFTYEIELKNDPPITIIHGPNGSGKTVIFKMVAGLFNSNYFIFWKYPFKEFRVDFDDNTYVTVTKDQNENERIYPVITFSQVPNTPYILDIYHGIMRRIPSSIRRTMPSDEIDDFLIKLSNEGMQAGFYDSPIGEYLSDNADELLFTNEKEPNWLIDLSKTLNVNLIETNRLSVEKQEIDERYSRVRIETQIVSAIEDNSQDLANRIQSIILRADTEAKILDRTFPNRVIESIVSKEEELLPYSEIREQLNILEEKRKRLVDVGLLQTNEQATEFQIPEDDAEYKEDTTLRRVLQLYIHDTENKLSVYLELAEKIEIFKDIIQGMLRHKQLTITKDGFQIVSEIGRKVPLRELSSGEQHMFVLIYTLLFSTTSDVDELILIDEPEISLHIAWQKRFIADLEKINELTKFDIIIATHSPAIINGRLDLLVGIQGKSEDS